MSVLVGRDPFGFVDAPLPRRFWTRKIGLSWHAVGQDGQALTSGRASEQATVRFTTDLYIGAVWEGTWEDSRD